MQGSLGHAYGAFGRDNISKLLPLDYTWWARKRRGQLGGRSTWMYVGARLPACPCARLYAFLEFAILNCATFAFEFHLSHRALLLKVYADRHMKIAFGLLFCQSVTGCVGYKKKHKDKAMPHWGLSDETERKLSANSTECFQMSSSTSKDGYTVCIWVLLLLQRRQVGDWVHEACSLALETHCMTAARFTCKQSMLSMVTN